MKFLKIQFCLEILAEKCLNSWGWHMAAVRQCLILAAGNGSRIASVAGGVPKPLVPLCGVPLLEHVMTSSREAGIERFVIVAGYRADLIRKWLSDRLAVDARHISITIDRKPGIPQGEWRLCLGRKDRVEPAISVADVGPHFRAENSLRRCCGSQSRMTKSFSRSIRRSIVFLTWTMQPRSDARGIRSLRSAKIFPVITRWTPECSYAARRSSAGSNRQGKMETARYRTACASWRKTGN